jgi:hypothetical protein
MDVLVIAIAELAETLQLSRLLRVGGEGQHEDCDGKREGAKTHRPPSLRDLGSHGGG